jgi:hypothetical protein|nr:MAG TPA: hypothetical protein [Caudoviricetes sp.]
MTAKKIAAKVTSGFRDKYKPDVGYSVGDIIKVTPQRFKELQAAGVVEEFKAVTVRETKE